MHDPAALPGRFFPATLALAALLFTCTSVNVFPSGSQEESGTSSKPADSSDYDSGYGTRLSPADELTVVRRPAPSDFGRFSLPALPAWKAGSNELWQVDLRGYDLSGLDLSDRLSDLLHADFDSVTKWPASLPVGFVPGAIMELGKNPGLGLRSLHADGITGKGVSVAVIDQQLLTEHVEYADRLRMYEEIHCVESDAQMHGPAVASIAVGKTVGVAPEADLYYIAETHGVFTPSGFVWDFTHLAKAVDRIIEVNGRLPPGRKIRVISISVGWSGAQKGYREIVAAVERAKKQGVFVVSSSLEQTYGGKLAFHALGREPLSDPDSVSSYLPGAFWAPEFYRRGGIGTGRLLVPMDARCTASPTGDADYVFYPEGGWSWSIPYIAGLYALACQVRPDVTPELFWRAAMKTGVTADIEHDGAKYTLGTIADPVALIGELVKAPR